jgi:predicted dehydrogenase
MAKLKVGLIGAAHGHVNHVLELLRESEQGSLVTAALDSKGNAALKARMEKIVTENGVDPAKVYTDYKEMLTKGKPDVVLNYTDHIDRAEVTEYVADEGLPQMLEKPMAYNLNDADRMLKAAQKHNTVLMVNWPSMWSPALRKAHQLYQDGVLGDLVHYRTRSGHYSATRENYGSFYDFLWMGTVEAGGAFLDFTCYGTAFAVWLAGLPTAVMATAGNFVKDFMPGPDCGILVLLYPKATAEIEATWNQIGRVPSPTVIYGTKASLSIGATLKLYTLDERDGVEVPVDPLPAIESGPIEYFFNAVMNDKPIGGICDPALSRDAQEAMEAGLASAAQGKVIPLPLAPELRR